MTAEPYASAERVFWVVDNGSSHRGQASIDRLEGAWKNLRLVHLPVHASWLDQADVYFSVVQRKVVNHNDFFDLAEIEVRLAAFEQRYNPPPNPSTGSSPGTTSTSFSSASPPTSRQHRSNWHRPPER